MKAHDHVNGAAMAAMLSGAIGAFAMGAFVLLHEAAVYSAPAFYGPAGGLSGRTTMAVVVWLVSWAVLHFRWRGREIGILPAARAAFLFVAAGIIATVPTVWSLVAPSAHAAQAAHATHARQAVAIPASLEAEHEEIHAQLVKATKMAGPVGAAAKELAAVLEPHFARENQIALPPLGLLAPLAAGEKPEGVDEVLAMTRALRQELPAMLQEHVRIRAATEALHRVATQHRVPEVERFAEALAAHARMEEEVLYPAAILVGDILGRR